MSLTPSLKLLTLAGLLSLVTAISGCTDSAFESSFVYSQGTLSLMREARDGTKENLGVKRLLDDRFGNPQHLKAWGKCRLILGSIDHGCGNQGVTSRSESHQADR